MDEKIYYNSSPFCVRIQSGPIDRTNETFQIDHSTIVKMLQRFHFYSPLASIQNDSVFELFIFWLIDAFWKCMETILNCARIEYKSCIQTKIFSGKLCNICIVGSHSSIQNCCCCCVARALHVPAPKMQNFKLVICKFATTTEYRCSFL